MVRIFLKQRAIIEPPPTSPWRYQVRATP